MVHCQCSFAINLVSVISQAVKCLLWKLSYIVWYIFGYCILEAYSCSLVILVCCLSLVSQQLVHVHVSIFFPVCKLTHHFLLPEMPIYGYCPRWEDFYLVVCDVCGHAIKPQALKQHIGKIWS